MDESQNDVYFKEVVSLEHSLEALSQSQIPLCNGMRRENEVSRCVRLDLLQKPVGELL